MQEKVLHAIWQHSLFRTQNLRTLQGDPLHILQVGVLNTNQGPDFLSAKIHIGSILWAGNVEIDLRTSLWNTHKHHLSPHFNNVVLHVVWENDMETPPHQLPILELKHIVSLFFVQSFLAYTEQNQSALPCQSMLSRVPFHIWDEWKNILIEGRFEFKAQRLQQTLQAQHGDWEQTCWIWLAQYMGGKQNASAFEEMARHIPISAIYKEKSTIEHIESLLFGVLGILYDSATMVDERVSHLRALYEHLAIKYSLQKNTTAIAYFRMRPYQFPDLRLAQLATLLFVMPRVIDIIVDSIHWHRILDDVNKVMPLYWNTHFRLGKITAKEHSSMMGEDFQHTLVINVLLVCLFAYGKTHGKQGIQDIKAMLQSIPPEKNTISRFWEEVNHYKMKNAYDSQAHLELSENYCRQKRCSSCHIGRFLLGRLS